MDIDTDTLHFSKYKEHYDNPKLKPILVSNIAKQLEKDISCINAITFPDVNCFEKVSVCAYYAPREKSSFDEIVKLVCKEMDITPAVYRKNYIVPLTEYLNGISLTDFESRQDCFSPNRDSTFENNVGSFYYCSIL